MLLHNKSTTNFNEICIIYLLCVVFPSGQTKKIKNLRSQVSRVAIHSTGKMFQHFGKQMEQVKIIINFAQLLSYFFDCDFKS